MFKHPKILINIGPCNALHLCVCISPWLKRIDDRTNLLYKSNERKKKYVYQTNCGDLGEGKVRRREKKNNELQSRWNAIHRFNMRVNYFSVEIEQCYSFHYYCYSAPMHIGWCERKTLLFHEMFVIDMNDVMREFYLLYV